MRDAIMAVVGILLLLVVACVLDDKIQGLLLRVEYLEWDLQLRQTAEIARIRREIEEGDPHE